MAIKVSGITVVDDSRSLINAASITLPSGNATNQPISAANGMIRFNPDLRTAELYNGLQWIDISNTITPKSYFLSQS
jgi:hypothetical protein